MVLFRGVINKQLGMGDVAERWRNVYTIQANDPSTALAALDQIRMLEQLVFTTEIYFSTIAVYSVPPGAGWKVESVNALGNATPGTDRLPLWVACRVDIASGDASRPERKYLRLPLYEDNIVGSNISPGTVSFIQTNYADALVGQLDYVGPSGEAHTSATVFAPLQMRQSGWHRRYRPGFKRGWVPVA